MRVIITNKTRLIVGFILSILGETAGVVALIYSSIYVTDLATRNGLNILSLFLLGVSIAGLCFTVAVNTTIQG